MFAFVTRHLDPSERMAELLFGVIMTLTFTLGTGLLIREEGPAATRDMLVGVLGCNLAWGIIDGLFYIFGAMYARGLGFRASTQLAREGRTATAARLDRMLDETYGEAVSTTTRAALRDEVLAYLATTKPPPVRMTRDDLEGALACFLLVIGTSVPAVLPFLLFKQHLIALRVSNLLLVSLMFVIGWTWASYINANRWRVGLGIAAGGLLLVQATILLGG